MSDNSILYDLTLYREEFTLGHGNAACLLVHGLGCGPIQMRELAEDLREWGFYARVSFCLDIAAIPMAWR